jgi:hypothetical protein
MAAPSADPAPFLCRTGLPGHPTGHSRRCARFLISTPPQKWSTEGPFPLLPRLNRERSGRRRPQQARALAPLSSAQQTDDGSRIGDPLLDLLPRSKCFSAARPRVHEAGRRGQSYGRCTLNETVHVLAANQKRAKAVSVDAIERRTARDRQWPAALRGSQGNSRA